MPPMCGPIGKQTRLRAQLAATTYLGHRTGVLLIVANVHQHAWAACRVALVESSQWLYDLCARWSLFVGKTGVST